MRSDKKAKNQAEENYRKEQEYRKKYNVPAGAYQVTLFVDYMKEYGTKSYLWFDRNVLHILPYEHHSGNLFQIKLNNINYFTRKGDFYTETVVSGGGGSSVKGAVIGGMIAGSTGAIIGSRKKSEPVKSNTHVVDKRKTIIEYRTPQASRKFIYLDSEAYNILMKEVPEMEKD